MADIFVTLLPFMPNPEQNMTERELSPLVEILARQFINRWDMYPKQLVNGTYVTIKEPLNISLLFAHLRGEITLGTYLLNSRSQGRYLVFDADSSENWVHLLHIAHTLALEGVGSYLEQSRRGGHLWLFLDKKYSGRDIRLFGQGILGVYGIDKLELYPKQAELKDGPGSLIRLPFGLHLLNNQRYGFITPDGYPIAPTVREQAKYLSSPCMLPEAVFNRYKVYQEAQEGNARSKRTTMTYKGIPVEVQDGLLSERIKAIISVREFIGQFVELSPKGKGLCPFHDDHRPSFSIHDKRNYWHCFTCQTGGSVIDFWMQYQGIDFSQAVKELAEMLL